jgi:hypothetical protein
MNSAVAPIPCATTTKDHHGQVLGTITTRTYCLDRLSTDLLGRDFSFGHISVSSKGVAGTFHVMDGRKVWYEVLTGSGMYTCLPPRIGSSQDIPRN